MAIGHWSLSLYYHWPLIIFHDCSPSLTHPTHFNSWWSKVSTTQHTSCFTVSPLTQGPYGHWSSSVIKGIRSSESCVRNLCRSKTYNVSPTVDQKQPFTPVPYGPPSIVRPLPQSFHLNHAGEWSRFYTLENMDLSCTRLLTIYLTRYLGRTTHFIFGNHVSIGVHECRT